jgi:hypothetical protein
MNEKDVSGAGGLRVQVDISGLAAEDASRDVPRFATGTLKTVDIEGRKVTVQLDASVGGHEMVTVPSDRVCLIESWFRRGGSGG